MRIVKLGYTIYLNLIQSPYVKFNRSKKIKLTIIPLPTPVDTFYNDTIINYTYPNGTNANTTINNTNITIDPLEIISYNAYTIRTWIP